MQLCRKQGLIYLEIFFVRQHHVRRQTHLTVIRRIRLFTSEVMQVCLIKITCLLSSTKYLKMHLIVKIVFTVEGRREKKKSTHFKWGRLPSQQHECGQSVLITSIQIYANNESTESILTTDANHGNNQQL